MKMKMMKLIGIMLLFGVYPMFAQQRGVEITGKVQEEATKTAIEQASVRLLLPKDSSMWGGVARRGK